ncbi:hypothetical protein ACT29H_14205 [Thermophagus sp. OGC60D27]|uniref:hypothetical protein n=1 Tax=Thermophagus sp. OGC60D27 TaxID=3458415 RepID=UPI004037687A
MVTKAQNNPENSKNPIREINNEYAKATIDRHMNSKDTQLLFGSPIGSHQLTGVQWFNLKDTMLMK